MFQGCSFIQGPKIRYDHCLSRQLLNFSLEFHDDFRSLPPQGFGPEAKTRGGTLGSPACIHTRNFKKVRNVLVVYGKFSRFDETRRALWSRVMVSVTCN